jgi:hypothetical protein
VSCFSGEVKGDQVSYEVWKYEVGTLMGDRIHSKEAVSIAARKSLRGEAANVAMRLGVRASLEDLLKKLDGIYGLVEPSESILAQFYSANQHEGEDVARWACRLEDLLDRAKKQRRISTEAAEEMLRTKLWSGLKPSLNEASRHKFDSSDSFDNLVIELRRIELEHRQRIGKTSDKSTVKTITKSATTTEGREELNELKGMINSLTSSVKSMQEEMSTRKKYDQGQQSSTGAVPKQKFQNTAYKQPNNRPDDDKPSNTGECVCWRCGQVGHVRLGCRVKLNNNNNTRLNESGPTSQGRQ